MRKPVYIIFIVVSAMALVAISAAPEAKEQAIEFQAKKFKFLLELAAQNHVDSVDIEKVSEAAYRALASELDKDSHYFTAEQMKGVEKRSKGVTVGIGIRIALLNDTVFVYESIEGGPAAKAGLRPGDILLFVDNKAVTGMGAEEINELLKGEMDSELPVISRRFTDNSLAEYTIKRGNVPISSMHTAIMLPGRKVGYIASNRFSNVSGDEFHQAAAELLDQGMETLIVDLRSNGGGSLDQVVNICDEFIGAGEKIMYSEAGNPDYYFEKLSTEKALLKEMPVIALVDGQSASASEIFAGMLQDLDRGLVVGSMSYGKGTMQNTWKLTDGSGFRMTVGRYMTPMGRRIDIARGEVNLDPALKLSAGEKQYNEIADIVKQFGGQTNLPVINSKHGRPLIASGKIIPDISVQRDTITLLSNVLQQKGIVLEYVIDYIRRNRATISADYSSFDKFTDGFVVSDSMLAAIKTLSFSKNIWNEEMYLRDKEYIANLTKAVMAQLLWGRREFYTINTLNDKVIGKALDSIDRAQRMLKHYWR